MDARAPKSCDATLRDARLDDCEPATNLCLRSKAVWGYDARFLEQSRAALSLTPQRLATWTVKIAEDRRARMLGVAAASVNPAAPRNAELELLFVEPDAIGTGVGKRLLSDLATVLAGRGVATLWILSDPGAEPFYRHFGAERVGMRPSDAIPGRSLPWLRLDLQRGRLPSL